MNRLTLLLVSLFFLSQSFAQNLSVSGTKIVNSSSGEEIILDAVNLGNWMVMEGYIMQSGGAASYQHDFKAKLVELIGQSRTDEFYTAWLNNYVTYDDIWAIKDWGFNAVRIPIHYEYFTALDQDVWYEQGFNLLSTILDYCSWAGIYAIIDLHAAPGGQGTGDICDYDDSKPSLWESQANKDKTVALWKEISSRFKDREWIAGYDLINEPHWALDGNADLRTLYGNITSAIRSNGDNHIVFVEGNWYANDFYGLTPAWDANMVYSFHKYWSYNDQNTIQGFLDLRSSENRPLWCGETGENSNGHYTMTMELFKAHGIGSSWWPMKKLESVTGFCSADFSDGYKDIISYWNDGGSQPNADGAYNTMMALAENLKLANCKVNSDVIYALVHQPNNRNTIAYSYFTIPGTIYSTDYDYGYQGYAYWDEVWEDLHVSAGDFTAWNTGWTYRNDGVDIQPCTDSESNGYNVGWFTQGEWMQYTSNILTTGTYSVEVRVANGGDAAGLVLKEGGDADLTTIDIPNTGGWDTWETVSGSEFELTVGSKPIRIECTSGAINFAQMKFTLIQPSIPVGQTIVLNNNGTYVSSNDGSDPIACDRPEALGWEKFTVIDLGNGFVALQGSNDNYVSSENGNAEMTCNRPAIGGWETFEWISVGDNEVAFLGNNGKYVSSEGGSSDGMNCNRDAYSGWEVFNWSLTTKSATISESPIEEQVKLYPNPVRDILFIDNSTEVNAIEIFDMTGKLVLSKTLSLGIESIDVSELNSGVYIARLHNTTSVNTYKIEKHK